MELDELEIGDARAGAIRHRDAVAGRDRRIGRLAVDLPRAAGRQQHHVRPRAIASVPSSCRNRAPTQRPPSTIRSTTRAWSWAVTLGRPATRCHSARPISRPVASAACSTRRALCAASMRKRELAVGIAIEARAPLDQLADVARAVLDEHLHGPLVAQPVAGGDRVGGVQRRRIVGADRGGDAALRVAGVALAWLRLGQDRGRGLRAPVPPRRAGRRCRCR